MFSFFVVIRLFKSLFLLKFYEDVEKNYLKPDFGLVFGVNFANFKSGCEKTNTQFQNK